MSIWDQFGRPEPVDVAGTAYADPQGYWSRLWNGPQTGPQVRDPQAMRTDPWVWSGGGTAARTSDLAWDEALMSPGQRKTAEVMGSEPASRLMMLGNFLGPKAPLPAPKSIRAYHGSPHDFDRFDLSKIGTGEGAQAYGHGLYFAEKEAIANEYRHKLADRPVITAGGESKFKPDSPEAIVAARLSDYTKRRRIFGDDPTPQQSAEAVKGELDKYIATAAKNNDFDLYKTLSDQRLALDRMSEAGIEMNRPGRMYEVNIKADPADFLDWDVPLSQQSEKVRAALGNPAAMGLKPQTVTTQNGTIYSGWVDNAGKVVGQFVKGETPPARILPDHPNVSVENLIKTYLPGENTRHLAEAGIPGIRYKDAGSRGAEGGTSNYVVFDDNLIEIIRKYGLAGLLAGGGALTQGGQAEAGQ